MRGRLAAMVLSGALLAATAGALAGCGDDPDPPPTACFDRDAIRAALTAAPAARRVADRTPISRCVERATSDEFLQDLGLVMTDVAHGLAERALGGDTRAAEQLGWLVGAVSRGAQKSQGVQLELARRLESSARRVQDEVGRRALTGGLHAGEQRG